MAIKTRNAVEVLKRLTGEDTELREMIAEEKVHAQVARMIFEARANQRLLRMEGDEVVFRYKDYRNGESWRTMQVHATELLRRFLLHVLPYRFVRIRYYGLLANRYRRQNIAQCRALLGAAAPEPLHHPAIFPS